MSNKPKCRSQRKDKIRKLHLYPNKFDADKMIDLEILRETVLVSIIGTNLQLSLGDYFQLIGVDDNSSLRTFIQTMALNVASEVFLKENSRNTEAKKFTFYLQLRANLKKSRETLEILYG